MKRILASLLAAAMLTGVFAGCSNSGGQSSSSGTSSSEAAEKPYEGTTLNVMLAYGGAEKSFDAFTEKTGIKIEYVEIDRFWRPDGRGSAGAPLGQGPVPTCGAGWPWG